MNIAIVTTWFERGAAYVSRQYRHLLARQHNVFIYARGGEAPAIGDPRWDDTGVTWASQGVVPIVSSIDLDEFGTWLRRHRIETVFFNEQVWWEPVLLADRLGVKTGAYVDYYTAATVPMFDAYDFLVCNTRRHHSVFQTHPQARYVPWGTDIEVFKPVSLGPVAPGYVTFFHSAGMSPPRKGSDVVLRAFAHLQGPARLVIHTQEPLDRCFPHLTELIDTLLERGTLTLYERTIPAPGLYHLGDVYVYPSRLDGIGLTLAEALACGLPAITSDCPPMSEFVDGTNGALIPVTGFSEREDGYYWPECSPDESALTGIMQGYVDSIADLPDRKRLARAYAEGHLDWTENGRDLPAFFQIADRISTPRKRAASAQALGFERRRARQSARFWLSYHFPRLTKAARDVVRTARQRRAPGPPDDPLIP